MTKKPMIEALRRGRDFLATHGWTRSGVYVTAGRRGYCAIGALYAGNDAFHGGLPDIYEVDARNFGTNPIRMAENLLDALANEVLPNGGGVTVFNDQRAKSKKDVLALYDEVIARAET